jgi:energy-coupling factor transporter ATP-binding protein EcfA2
MAIIELENVSFSYQNQAAKVLDGVSMSVGEGEIVLVCGPTGSGKTTLVRLFNGLIPHFHQGTLTGSVMIDGVDTVHTSTSKLSQIVGMVFQNPENQLVASNCEREIAFGPENIGLPRDEIRERIESAIELVGLESIRDSPPNALSGGQKQKVAIAAALALHPKIMVFDEPSSNLDPESTWKLGQTIEMLSKKLHSTIVIVEHRLEFFIQLATKITCMKNGRVLLNGSTENVIQNDDFYSLGVQIPAFLKVFKKLSDAGLYFEPIPVDWVESKNILQDLLPAVQP